jgi:hypothetical protein
MTEISNDMQKLVRCEEIVDKGVRNMLDAADALKEIRDNRLYKERGYSSFDQYLADEWGFGRSYIHKIIKSSETRKRLGTLVPDLDSSSLAETALRELNSVPDEQLEDVIDMASMSARTEGKRLTARAIRDARILSTPEVDPSTASLEDNAPSDKGSESNPYDLPQEKLDQSSRIALKSVDALRRHLNFLGINRYDTTLAKIRGELDK